MGIEPDVVMTRLGIKIGEQNCLEKACPLRPPTRQTYKQGIENLDEASAYVRGYWWGRVYRVQYCRGP